MIKKSCSFCDSTEEIWTHDKETNPLRVNRLGYRDNTQIILDFVRAGNQLVASREGYLNKDDMKHQSDNYFEDISTSVDNLQRLQNDVNDVLNEKSSDLSTSGGEPVKATEKVDADKGSPQKVDKPETSPSEET